MNKKADVIGIIGLLLAILTLIFGDNIYQQLKGHSIFQNPSSPIIDLPTEITDDKGVQMILIPAGQFKVGDTNSDYLDAFYIDKFEVTNSLYRICVLAKVCQAPSNFGSSTRTSYFDNYAYDNYPVIFVDWNMAMGYCKWRGGNLPTEAQWEKAAFGTDGRNYPWGESIDSTYANYNLSIGDTTEVGSYESGKSFYGIYDMGGNVAEWTTDLTSPIFFSPGETPQPTSTTPEYVGMVHGGSWDFAGDKIPHMLNMLSNGTVSMVSPAYTGDTIGFRCIRSVP